MCVLVCALCFSSVPSHTFGHHRRTLATTFLCKWQSCWLTKRSCWSPTRCSAYFSSFAAVLVFPSAWYSPAVLGVPAGTWTAATKSSSWPIKRLLAPARCLSCKLRARSPRTTSPLWMRLQKTAATPVQPPVMAPSSAPTMLTSPPSAKLKTLKTERLRLGQELALALALAPGLLPSAAALPRPTRRPKKQTQLVPRPLRPAKRV